MVVFDQLVLKQEPLPLDFSVRGGCTGMKRVLDHHNHHPLHNVHHHHNGGLTNRVPGGGGKMTRLSPTSPPTLHQNNINNLNNNNNNNNNNNSIINSINSINSLNSSALSSLAPPNPMLLSRLVLPARPSPGGSESPTHNDHDFSDEDEGPKDFRGESNYPPQGVSLFLQIHFVIKAIDPFSRIHILKRHARPKPNQVNNEK